MISPRPRCDLGAISQIFSEALLAHFDAGAFEPRDAHRTLTLRHGLAYVDDKPRVTRWEGRPPLADGTYRIETVETTPDGLAKVGGKVRLSVDGRAAPPLENPSGASGKGGKLARRFAANLGGTGRMDNKVETLERILHSSKVLGATLQPLAAALP